MNLFGQNKNTRRNLSATNRQKAPNVLEMEVEKDLTMLKKALMKKKEMKAKEEIDNKTVTPEELVAVERAINLINWQEVEVYPQERTDVI